MEALYKMFPENSEDFPWDERILQEFKSLIIENKLKCRMDDIFLLGFLRARKFNLERSLQLLKNYHSTKIKYSCFFKNMLPSKLEIALSTNCVSVLPRPDQNGRIVIIIEAKRWDPSNISLVDINRMGFLFVNLILNLHRTQEDGVVTIMNTQGATIRQLLEYTPRFMSTMAAIRNCSQLRIKEIHYVNMNSIIRGILSIFTTFLNAKIRNRIFIHSEMTTLHEYVHPEYLPAAYGGKLLDFDPNEFVEVVKQNEEYFRQNEEYLKMYDEAVQQKFSEGRFKYIDPDNVKFEEKFMEETEKKFNLFKEDPENYLKDAEENPLCEITQL